MIALGPALIASQGPDTAAVERNYAQALQLCAQKLLELAHHLDNDGLRLQGHHSLWASAFHLGKLRVCREHIEHGLHLYAEGDYRDHAAVYGGHDARVCALGEVTQTLWLLGYPDQALAYLSEALQWAQELTLSGSTVHALNMALPLYRYRRNTEEVAARAQHMIDFAEQAGFPEQHARGEFFQGWATVMLGDIGDIGAGLDRMRAALMRQQKIGTSEDFPALSEMLAECYAECGQVDQARRWIEDGLAESEKNHSHFWTAELYRRKGEILLLDDASITANAEACYAEALAISRRQAAKSLELRAAMALAGCYVRQNRQSTARDLLQPVHDWFVEGLDRADLKDAKALLSELV